MILRPVLLVLLLAFGLPVQSAKAEKKSRTVEHKMDEIKDATRSADKKQSTVMLFSKGFFFTPCNESQSMSAILGSCLHPCSFCSG